MKKFLWTFMAVIGVVSAGVCEDLWAETAELVQAGVAAAVKGEVKATTPPENTAHVLKDGDKIFMGDKIETGADGEFQILLLDQTFFTVGPLSTILVDEFIYDPESAGAKASVVKGIFRAVSDKAAQKSSEDAPDRSDSASAGLRM
jgi:trimeric autotransporter adhesin